MYLRKVIYQMQWQIESLIPSFHLSQRRNGKIEEDKDIPKTPEKKNEPDKSKPPTGVKKPVS